VFEDVASMDCRAAAGHALRLNSTKAGRCLRHRFALLVDAESRCEER